MKIAIDARELRTSTGRYIERLLYYLQQVDQTNDYLILLKPKDLAGWNPTNEKFKKIACPYKEFTLSEQIGFLKQVRKLNPDLMHFGMVQQPVLYNGRVVTTMHDLTTTRFRNPTKNFLVFTLKQFVYKWLNKRVARKSGAIITPTNFVKEDVAKFCDIKSDKIKVTHEAADAITEAAEEIKNLNGKKFIFYVGRALPHKNLTKLIESFKIINDSYDELFLVFAGKRPGNYEQLEKIAAKSSVREKIIFTGFVSDAELKWLYQNAEAYVFPSLSEGFGLPGLEAMVHGCPVVSSNATCLPEVYGDAAVYFDPNSAEDMAEKISLVLQDKNLRKDLIEKGHKQAAKYSWRRMAEQTLEVYKQALEQ